MQIHFVLLKIELTSSCRMISDETWDRVAREAARTVPGRENGGNCDIKVSVI